MYEPDTALSGQAESIRSQYQVGSALRQPYLDRARENAKLTIPALIPPDDSRTAAHKLPQPDNSIGARGVSNLTSKLSIALFPSNTPIFRMVIDDFEIQKFMDQIGKQGQGEVQKALSKIERAGMSEFDSIGARVPLGLALKHALVGGNYLIHFDPKTGDIRGYPLSHYCTWRDRSGNLLKIITEETVAFAALPTLAQVAVQMDKSGQDMKPETEVCIHTMIEKLPDGRWQVSQEAGGKIIPSVGGFYPADKPLPWIAIRLIPVEGEDYGRSLVEDLFGDLVSANNLRGAIVNFAKAAAKILFLVKPNSTTKPRVLTAAQSGDFVQGNNDDITVLMLDKKQDFTVAQQVLQDITRALEFAFLLQSAASRDAERVTAEEVRQIIAELDAGLGGLHAALSAELQLPFVKILLWRMEAQGKFKLPAGSVRPAIVTGIAALGRGQDRANLASAFQDIALLVNVPPTISGRIHMDELLNRVFASNNVNPDGLIMSDDEYAAEQQQQQLNSVAANAAPGAIQEVTKGLVKHATGDTQAAKAAAAPQ